MIDPHEEMYKHMLILDRMHEFTQQDALYPFAMDELLCKYTGQGGPPICHIWRHPRAFIIGLRDSRLPSTAKARIWLESLGYHTAIRNSGGAAVPLDEGVVNISLILPKAAGQGDLHFHRDFERMYDLIRQALRHSGVQIDKGEIAGAFCPGDYDLSIDGRKFCGIAQRRQSHAFVVQAFVITEGSGASRAELVREFYARAALGARTEDYPQVQSSSTASLQELTGMAPHAASLFAEGVKEVVRRGQSEQGLADAASRLVLPTVAEVQHMASVLQQRYNPAVSPN